MYLSEVREERGLLGEKNPPHELEVGPGCLSKTPEFAWDVLASARPVCRRLQESD